MNKTKLKVATDFSGIGAPEMALNNLGIDYDQIFSCEIDKFARKSYLEFIKHRINSIQIYLKEIIQKWISWIYMLQDSHAKPLALPDNVKVLMM